MLVGKTARIELPPKLLPVFEPARGAVDYRYAYGGRGSGKSFNFARMSAIFGYIEPIRILCGRELQVSIKDSMFAEIKSAIELDNWLHDGYEIGESYIKGRNGTEYIFKGLRHNISSIKSMARIDLCLIDEAEDISERSFIDLFPTIRSERSEIWALWNPRLDGSPIDKRFVKRQPSRSVGVKINYYDNPFFTRTLEARRLDDLEMLPPETYAHVWEGEYLSVTDAQVFRGKVVVRDFSPTGDWHGPYFGMDYGFANDPLAVVQCYVHDNRLWILKECGGTGVEIDDAPGMIIDSMPESPKYQIRADSARPETTSNFRRKGLPRVVSVDKWSGSIEDGVSHMRGYKEIVVHPSCRETAKEFRLYSHKVDRLTGDIMPDIVDAYNNYIDAIRYAITPMIRKRNSSPATAGKTTF